MLSKHPEVLTSCVVAASQQCDPLLLYYSALYTPSLPHACGRTAVDFVAELDSVVGMGDSTVVTVVVCRFLTVV